MARRGYPRKRERAKLRGVRCSRHTGRHTFATNFLRASGNLHARMAILGHITLKMVKRHIVLAETDIEAQHRQVSPMDRLKR